MEAYEKLYHELIDSGKTESMQALGKLFLWLMWQTKESNTAIFQEAVEKMKAATWCNYLTEHEAEEIVGAFINQNGDTGAHWSLSQVEAAVEGLGGKPECESYYNRYALYVAINMIYSDFATTLVQFVDEDKMVEVVYRLAVDKLKDKDRPRFIREYFGV